MDTANSRHSRHSRRSNQSRSQPRAQQSMASLFEEEEEPEKVIHPFDNIFGEQVNKYIQQNSGATTIGLTLPQFRNNIAWPYVFPHFICDLIETISGFSMKQDHQDRISRKEETERD